MKLDIPSSEALKTSGLSEREARVWYVLAIHDPLHITEIARHARLHRPAVYAQLEALMKKGLVEVLKGTGRRRYRTTGARRLREWSASHERLFVHSLANLAKRESQPLPPDIRIYRGKEIRRVWEDLACTAKKTVFYRYDAYPATLFVDRYIPQEYIDGLKSRGLERFVITNRALRKRSYVKRLECASRVLPEKVDLFEQGISQFIYADKIALVDFTTETAYVIQNQALAEFHRKLFSHLYQQLGE